MKQVIYLFIAWRLLLFFIAFISPTVIPKFGATFPYFQERLINSGLPHFIWSFGNFDGVHYLGIAKDGYAYQFTQAFFPFYPILIRLVSYLTFGNLLISALLISNIAFLTGLILFYKLISLTHNKKIAIWSIIFLLTFPSSYYFGAVYTEGLFFLMVISSFYLYQQKKIISSLIIGASASATRLIGLFLAPALISKRDLKSLVIVPLGFLAYVVYLKLKFNNPLYFLSSQTIFGQERSTTGVILLPQVFWRYFKILATTNGLPFFNASFELAMTVFAIVILVWLRKKVKLEWLIFSLLAVSTPTLTGTFASMPRYVLVAFPIFVGLAQIKNLKIKIIILTLSLVLLFAATALFTQGYWVA